MRGGPWKAEIPGRNLAGPLSSSVKPSIITSRHHRTPTTDTIPVGANNVQLARLAGSGATLKLQLRPPLLFEAPPLLAVVPPRILTGCFDFLKICPRAFRRFDFFCKSSVVGLKAKRTTVRVEKMDSEDQENERQPKWWQYLKNSTAEMTREQSWQL